RVYAPLKLSNMNLEWINRGKVCCPYLHPKRAISKRVLQVHFLGRQMEL
ncbi:mutarotase, YjhT family, partial [Vibrio cholerae HC-50A2]